MPTKNTISNVTECDYTLLVNYCQVRTWLEEEPMRDAASRGVLNQSARSHPIGRDQKEKNFLRG